MQLNYHQNEMIQLIRERASQQLKDSRYVDARLASLGHEIGSDIVFPLTLSNDICLYFWEWHTAKDHVRRFSALATYEDGWMTHNPMYTRNTQKCIMYRNALRQIPILRRLYKLFVNELKALGSINAVVAKYASTDSFVDEVLRNQINECNVRRRKSFPTDVKVHKSHNRRVDTLTISFS